VTLIEFQIVQYDLTKVDSASIETVSLNLARHKRASCIRPNASGLSEKNSDAMSVFRGIKTRDSSVIKMSSSYC
jgi:hypothetical protein